MAIGHENSIKRRIIIFNRRVGWMYEIIESFVPFIFGTL